MPRPRKPPHIKPRGGILYACLYQREVGPDGREIERFVERSTSIHDTPEGRKKAESLLAQWLAEAADPDGYAAKAFSLNDALALVLENTEAKLRQGKRSGETLNYYKRKAGVVLEFFEGAEPNRKPFPISRWETSAAPSWALITKRRADGADDSTIRKELGVIRTALGLARERGLFRGDPSIVIPAKFGADDGPPGRSPTREEVLRLLPHLLPDQAAVVCFILATTAEMAALVRARRADLPDLEPPAPTVPVRGTKNEDRNRFAPIVTDEQRLLMKFVAQHAEGTKGRLFSTLSNINRALIEACEAAGIESISPHDLRHSAGQWLLDQGIPIEVVSRVMGHTNTAITEKVYARMKKEDVGRRMLEAVPQSLAQQAHARKEEVKQVATLKSLPSPRPRGLSYEVDGKRLSLNDWAKESGIPKATLHHRVVTRGLGMAEALQLGRGQRGVPLVAPTTTSENHASGNPPETLREPLDEGGQNGRSGEAEQPRETGEMAARSGSEAISPEKEPDRRGQKAENPRDSRVRAVCKIIWEC